MSGNYRFSMDQQDIVQLLITNVGSFIRDRLIDKEQRIRQKEQCAERLAAEGGSNDMDTEVRYSDQAVLANLDWGIDALEEAINTSNMETKLARLDYAEKMLQVCAMLNSQQKTAGVPNFYLSAWAHLNLSYLWMLRNEDRESVLHVIEMFIVDPFFSRIDFAPDVWRDLFLPHMNSIAGWYTEARHRLVMEAIPDASDLSFTADMDQFLNESVIFSMRPDQMEKTQKLEQLYRESLDENTRLYAKYYRDCLNCDSSSGKKAMPMFPIAEPPMTPLHELSRSIPDYMKFGPILPKSAGFSPILKSYDGVRQASRLRNVASSISEDMEEDVTHKHHEELTDKNDNDSECDNDEPSTVSEYKNRRLISLKSMRIAEERSNGPKGLPYPAKVRRSPKMFSPVDSPQTTSKVSSPKADKYDRKEPAAVLPPLSGRIRDSTMSNSLPQSPRLNDDFSINSAKSDGEAILSRRSCRKSDNRSRSISNDYVRGQVFDNSFHTESDDDNNSCISLPLSDNQTSRTKPPKDFVCPITGQLFSDPVTLETGQTYERRAIQEWIERGNTTCPITRQALSANTLPKTNYVLKRLITSWKEQYPDIAQELSYAETPRNSMSSSSMTENLEPSNVSRTFDFPSNTNSDGYMSLRRKRFTQGVVSTSPTSVISQAAMETIINGLKPHVSCLCTSEDLQECEVAVLTISKTWKETKGDPAIHSYLSKPTTVNGLVEILSASLNREVLRYSIYILSELIHVDEPIGETLTSIDSDFDCLAELLKNGLAEAAVLIYQLRPAYAQLSANNLVPSLVQLILNKSEDLNDLQLLIEPKDAAIAMLEQILMGGDENSRSVNAQSVISANGVPGLIKYMDKVEGRQSIISILLCCIHADRTCRNLIANRIELSSVLDLFHAGNDTVRGICIEFLLELVQTDRRTISNQILQLIKDEGAFSTMHTLLVHLQMAPMEQQPAIATLLLMLDLLVEPRNMSIYREEAIEALIEALQKKDFPSSQITALNALLCLSGRMTASGKSCTEAWLLKVAGFDQPFNALMKGERPTMHENELAETMEEEEKAANSWERRVAFVLCNHERGVIFKALEECLKSNSIEMAKSCLVIAAWLTYILSVLPDTGMKNAARKSFLEELINVLQSSKNLEEKILATLAIKTFIGDPVALEELGMYAKCIYKMLRKLKKHSVLVADILKALMNLTSVNATELWSCSEVIELESSANGEVLCLLHLKGLLLSSHSDGTIKVWDAGKRVLRLIQEVREHTKAVTCLYVPPSGDRLYSGSLDKTIRVWVIKPEEIHCLQVHDVKEPVYELTANAHAACFISQGTGVKVYNWSGTPKHINFSNNKMARCLAMAEGKLYCGCSGYSIQEVDLGKSTSGVFYSGTRKLLGKKTIHSLLVHDNLLFAGGSSVDGTAGKVFSLPSKAISGSLSTGFDIQRMAVSNDFIFTATKCGIIEVWLKERVARVASIKMGSGGNTAKTTSLAADTDGGMLFAGSSDGKIQVWTLD
ncbi:hypothetical protein ACJRO7_022762 [Eucalyptus globulus]|uniref:RING-type E3 ubiquitin transferase n=1 Tax=Eucalyptus globulus TaxID=34317 RepID=A0ABD3K314_EUCGL